MTLVTVSASYGAGGSEVGPALAAHLGVRFVDRALTSPVADVAAHAEDSPESEHVEERLPGGFWAAIARLAPAAAIAMPGGVVDPVAVDRLDYRSQAEDALRAVAAAGDAVVLGRAAALALRDRPGALHVRLDGPVEARVQQAMRIEGVDEPTARRRLRDTDRARERYVRDFYATDPRDPGLYALVLDGTRLPTSCCVATIAAALDGLTAAPAAA